MAGIGFALRRMLASESLTGKAQAYAVAGVIGSGPWVLSIAAMLLIALGQPSMLAPAALAQPVPLAEFQVSVTWLMVASLLLTAPVQLAFTRYCADRMFAREFSQVVPNLWGVLLLTMLLAFVVGVSALAVWFQDAQFSPLYRLAGLLAFVSLCCVWIVVSLTSAIQQYWHVFGVFVLCYGTTVLASLGLGGWGLGGLLLGFAIGQVGLMFCLLALVMRQFPATQLLAFDFLQRQRMYPRLMLTGVFFTMGLWVDKFIFWADPLAGVAVVGALRASPLYDVPVFLSYLSLLPGMAVFLLHLETDVALQSANFHRTITRGGTLAQIRVARDRLVRAVQSGLLAVLKVQTITTLLALATSATLLRTLGLSQTYLPLFQMHLMAVAVELVLLSAMNVLFYLDQRQAVLRISLFFALSNGAFSWASLQLHPMFLGSGLGLSVLLTSIVALATLWRKLQKLEYETFMLRPVHY
jgi:uncharacterized membrane protein